MPDRILTVKVTRRKLKCKAKSKRTGNQCGRWAVNGMTVCPMHGGAKGTPGRAKAEEQLKEARDELMSLLLGIARDTTQSANDRLKAITWALERAGFKTGMKVELEMPPWQSGWGVSGPAGKHPQPTRRGTGAPSAPPLRVVGYVRVSTEEQGRDGHGLRAQIDYLRRYCEANGLDLVTVMMDVVSTRRTARMIGRAATVAAVEAGAADAILIRAIDRVTRSVKDGADLLASCASADVRLLSCDGYDSADEETQLTANIKIAVAQEERRLISRRTREGLARARAEGRQLGRKSTVPPDVVYRIAQARGRGESYRFIAQDLDAAGIATPGGSPNWRAAAVREIYRRTTTEEIERLGRQFAEVA